MTLALNRFTVFAMFVAAFSVVGFQIALMRLMSVIASYHSAFLVLSIVMLGLSAASIQLFKNLKNNPDAVTTLQISQITVRGAIAGFLGLVLSLIIQGHLSTRLLFAIEAATIAACFYYFFYCAGYIVSFLLTRCIKSVSQLYWFDLLGAACGCFTVIFMIDYLTAPGAMLVYLVFLALSGFSVGLVDFPPSKLWPNALISVILAGFLLTGLVHRDYFSPAHPIPEAESLRIWEGWNSLAQITVYNESPNVIGAVRQYKSAQPTNAHNEEYLKRLLANGGGLSTNFRGDIPPLYHLELDRNASTPIVGRRNYEALSLEFLKWDITAIAYSVIQKPIGDVFIIGGGGGRDVLTAQIYDAKTINVAEINPTIIEAVQEEFGDFSGRPYSGENIDLSIDEARSVLSQKPQLFDLIQMSLIDTWAASMAGTLVLTENGLYTREAFSLFLNKLSNKGVLSISRWYRPDYFAELGRVLRLGVMALQDQGISEAEKHIIAVYNQGYFDSAIVTVLIKRTPFTGPEISRLQKVSSEKGFSILWMGQSGIVNSKDSQVAQILSSSFDPGTDQVFDLTAPTDNRPFFFNLRHMFSSWKIAFQTGDFTKGSTASLVLLSVFLFLVIAFLMLIVRPLIQYNKLISADTPVFSNFIPLLLYFGGIGTGFMLIEIALIQRFAVFLGHPTYSITVVLFSLLLFSGVGSLSTSKVRSEQCLRFVQKPLSMIVLLALFFATVVPLLLQSLYGWTIGTRIMLVVLLIAPLGLCMGMIFPCGAKFLDLKGLTDMVPYVWGINGIASIFGLTLGMWVAMAWGYTGVLYLSFCAYTLTFIATKYSWDPHQK